jgi:rare lipoprotein A (peptidoglycan hydrolase)
MVDGFETVAIIRPSRNTLRVALMCMIAASFGFAAFAKATLADSLPKGGGYYKLGPSYQIMGRRYTPEDTFDMDVTGTASWYGAEVHGRKTANGEIFDMHALTAAHKTLPLPSYVYVTNIDNGRRLLVRVNDRGPFVGDRMIDVSDRAAQLLGFSDRGLTTVRIEYAGPAPLDGDDSREHAAVAELRQNETDAPVVPQRPTRPSVIASLDVEPSATIRASIAKPAVEAGPSNTVSLVASTPHGREPMRARTAIATDKPRAVKVSRVAALRSVGTLQSDGYRPFDPCWSCLSRDQQ